MEIRPGTDHDIPAIVNLLKLSLGEELLPKSEAYWRWKHVDNPFGRSKVLLAIERNEIVGVRAFMRWTWTHHGRLYEAVRAVDTATHPQHQGKGIFKTLTLKLVDECKNEGLHFIFNTPNAQSCPGYLKMGWEPAGKIPISFHINKPFAVILRYLGSRDLDPSLRSTFSLSNFQILDELSQHKQGLLHTLWSEQFLRWRYEQVPVATYGTLQINNLSFLVYRIKQSRFGVELRICDIFADSKESFLALVKKLYNLFTHVHYSTLSGFERRLPGLSVRSTVGPLVTIRNLNLPSLRSLIGFQEWSPSLGDLELF
jgi:GNAT superfamily N-acetyltransferase